MLTIEQLKSLNIDDWIWFVDKYANDGAYWQIYKSYDNGLVLICGDNINMFSYSEYGTAWCAYKNKEESEGKSITLPYLLCTSWQFACVIWRDTDGKVKKTHTYPMQEAKAILREKEQLQCKS